MRHPNVRNADEVEVREMIKGRHNMRLRQLGKPAGSIALGATLTEVAPGGISFPRHAHYVNEEAIYVLSGSGEARIGDARVPVRPGDWIALPTGPEHAHQMVNVSAAEPHPLTAPAYSEHRSTMAKAREFGRKLATPAAPTEPKESPSAVSCQEPKGKKHPQISPSDEIKCRERGGSTDARYEETITCSGSVAVRLVRSALYGLSAGLIVFPG